MKQKVKYKGILFIVLSALCFAFMNMFVRMAGDLPAVQKSFFRNLVAFIIALATMVRHKEGGKRKLEVYDFAGRLRNTGDPV